MENRRTTTTTRSITQSKQTDEFKKPKTLENQRATRSVTQHFSKIEEPRELAKSSSSANTQIQNPKTLGKSRSTKKYHNKIVCKKGKKTKVRSKIIIQKNTRFDSVEFSVCMCVLADGLLAGLAPLDFVRDLVAPSLVLQMIFFPNIFFSIALKMPGSLQDKALRDEFVKWIEYAADDGALHNTIVRNNHFWKLLHHFDLATIVADPIFLNAWSECIALRNITYSLGVDIPMATHHGTLKSIDPHATYSSGDFPKQ